MSDENGSIRSLSRGLAVLQAINQRGTASVTEIARAVGLPHPTAIRIVQTLIGLSFVERVPGTRRYRPTALVQSLASGFLAHDRLVQVARGPIVELTREIGWPLSLVTRVGGQMVTRDSTVALTSLTFTLYGAGVTMPMFGSAAGEVSFAFCSPEEQAEMLAHSGDEIIDPERLAGFRSGELGAMIRERGYAVGTRNPQPRGTSGNLSLAVPILSAGQVLGALTVVIFLRAMSAQEAAERYLTALRATADAIGEAMRTDEQPNAVNQPAE